ncbi:MAG: CoA transferase, partial [Rhodospirillales bacterium]|nr:CoA transferase [Rhodospirillales bacterium]
FREHNHPSEGELIAPDTPYRLNGLSLPLRQPAPRLGEHTREILAEAGYDDDAINTMMEQKS